MKGRDCGAKHGSDQDEHHEQSREGVQDAGLQEAQRHGAALEALRDQAAADQKEGQYGQRAEVGLVVAQRP